MKLKTLAAAIALATSASAAQATTIDLITSNSGTANGSIYNWVPQGSTGTGLINPFVRVQNSSGTEQGYNYDSQGASGGAPWETKTGTWTHDIQFKDLTLVNIAGTNYYEFLLDINETGKTTGTDPGAYISLNDVKIFSNTSALTTTSENPTLSFLGTKRYDMDIGANGDVTVNLDSTRNSGSGYGDMLMYVQASNFAGVSANDYIYFYTSFGRPYSVDSGFEEWALRKVSSPPVCTTCPPPPPPEVLPEPTPLALLGLGLLGFMATRKRKAA